MTVAAQGSFLGCAEGRAILFFKTRFLPAYSNIRRAGSQHLMHSTLMLNVCWAPRPPALAAQVTTASQPSAPSVTRRRSRCPRPPLAVAVHLLHHTIHHGASRFARQRKTHMHTMECAALRTACSSSDAACLSDDISRLPRVLSYAS